MTGEEQLEQLRAAATDCARVADDYDGEGLRGIADRFRDHAAHLWLIAGATPGQPSTTLAVAMFTDVTKR